MATTNLILKSFGDLSISHGVGTPDHTATLGTLYVNLSTGLWYRNNNGTTGWDESEALSSADQTKLDGIEAGADVTDATNVDAAGATMNSDTTLVGNAYFLDDDTMAANDATKAVSQQSLVAYVAAQIAGAITTGMDYKGGYNATTNTPVLSEEDFVLTGSIDPTASTSVIGVGTLFLTELQVGDSIRVNGETRVVATIVDNLNLTVTVAFTDVANDITPEKVGNIIAVNIGDTYTVTAAGNFFSAVLLEIGDTLIANQNGANDPNMWTIVQANLTAASIKTQYESNTNTNAYTDAEAAKVGFITVTQAVDLDTIESDTTTNNAKVTNATHTGDVTGDAALTIGAKKVTLAMMEDGVDGELITYDATGVAAKVATGNAGQVLTSNGTGTAPTFQANAATPAKITGTVNTTNATVTTVDTIDTLTDNSTHIIDVFVAVEQDTNVTGGVWMKKLFVTKRAGTVVIQTISNEFSADDTTNLDANSVTAVVNGGNIDIQVAGFAATNYNWNSAYEILIKSTN